MTAAAVAEEYAATGILLRDVNKLAAEYLNFVPTTFGPFEESRATVWADTSGKYAGGIYLHALSAIANELDLFGSEVGKFHTVVPASLAQHDGLCFQDSGGQNQAYPYAITDAQRVARK